MSKSHTSFTSKPWITTAIANSIKSKNKIYKKFCKEKNPQQREIYGKQFKTYRNHLTTLLRITKDEYYKTHFQENKKDLKTVWKTIKEIINVKTKNDVPINSLLIGETITTNAKLIANHFNTFFTSVAAKLNEKIVKAKKPFSHYLGQITDETIFLSPTTPADIESLINCIKPNKAIGPNSIPTKILKEFKTELSEPLSDMINVSFNKGIFPDFLKVANVVPIHSKVKN